MRILDIRLRNLNSLVGEWYIDFTDPAFLQEGIFTIAGPTGSGKTTILDALCLALYGQTPRLGKITSSNEIMSRQEDTCMAEVTFETQAGVYRSHFSQKWSKGRNGTLQKARREIVDARTGAIVASKTNNVANTIVELTGMDFVQFTRSMLLAQGSFAAFLQANSEERAALLEKITGIDIYSRLSVTVFERQRSERENLQKLEAEATALVVFSSEEEQAKQTLLTQERERETLLRTSCTKTQQAIVWRKNVAKLASERDEVNRAIVAHTQACQQFAHDGQRLLAGRQAETLRPAWGLICATRDALAKDQAKSRVKHKEYTVLCDKEQRALTEWENKKEALKQVLESQAAMAPVLQAVREADTRLSSVQKLVHDSTKAVEQAEALVAKDHMLCVSDEKNLAHKDTLLAAVVKELAAHAKDAELEALLGGLTEQMAGLERSQKRVDQLTADRKSAEKAMAAAKKTLEQKTLYAANLRRTDEEAAQKLVSLQKNLAEILGEKLLREYRDEKEFLLKEALYIKTIQDLSSWRTNLVAGQACPLCGSLEHPYVNTALPKADAVKEKIDQLTVRIKKAEEGEMAIRKAEAEKQRLQTTLSQAENAATAAQCTYEAKKQAYHTLCEEHQKASNEWQTLVADFCARVAPFGCSGMHPKDSLAQLHTRASQWKSWRMEEETLTKERAALALTKTSHETTRAGHQEALLKEQEHKKELEEQLREEQGKRQALFGNKNPDREEKAMNDRVNTAKQAEETSRKQWETAQLNTVSLAKECEVLDTSIAQALPKLAKEEEDFATLRASQGFVDEKAFQAALLSKERLAQLAERESALQAKSIELESMRVDREKRFQDEMAKAVSEQSLEALTQAMERSEHELRTCQESIVQLTHALTANEAMKTRRAEYEEALAKQRGIVEAWKRLNTLIGSADGKKFRTFAQALTFEMLIKQANIQLQQMTDRYLLVHSNESGLELNVMDNYQAGLLRSTKNLSGGEAFLVSLSLALGLSHMASQNVRVDSLFLDEGFGTLDEDTLETVLQTLATLRESGKVIGVISHIQALQERIQTQIHVEPTHGGISILTGAGVRRA